MRNVTAMALTLLALSLANSSLAGPIVDHADVNGLRTFQDLDTGLVWADLDNFFGLSFVEMKAAARAAGFKVANVHEVRTLLDSLPLPPDPDTWDAYAEIMGSAPNRELIWGAYQPEGSSVSWAFAFRGQEGWSFNPFTGFRRDEVLNADSPFADMNIWAYRNDALVPEPSSFALLGLGTLVACAARLRVKSARK